MRKPKPRRDDRAAADYEVGYRRPPHHGRFKPGQSGNPKGRPKAARAPKDILEQALSALVTITEGGVTRKIELREALFRSLLAKAIKGDTRAVSLVVQLMQHFGLSKPDGERNQPITVRFDVDDKNLL